MKSLPFMYSDVDDLLMIRLMDFVGKKLSLKYPEIVEALIDELKEDYHFSVNKAIVEFRLRVAGEEQRSHFHGLQIFLGPDHTRPSPGK